MAAPPPMDEQSQTSTGPTLLKVKREKVSLPAAGDEQLRLLLEKPTEGRSWSRSRAAATSLPAPARSGGQQTITSYFRGSVAAGVQRKGADENDEDAARKTPPVDSESIRGRFGWTSFGNVHVPYIFRQSQRYASVRIIERTLLKKFLRALPTDVYSCTYIKSYYLTNNEANLFNEINRRHCECQFGTDDFTVKDLVVLLADVEQLLNFLSTCYSKLAEHDKSFSSSSSSSSLSSSSDGNGTGTGTGESRCGFVKLKAGVVPYVSRDGTRYVPSSLLAGEPTVISDNYRTEKLDTWEVSYLKFCCKVAGMRHEFLNCTQCVAVAIGDGQYEEWWPANCHSHLANESEGQQLKRRRESSTAGGSVITCFLPPASSDVTVPVATAPTVTVANYNSAVMASSADSTTTAHGNLTLPSPPQPFMYSRQWWGPMTTHSQTCYPSAPPPPQTTVSCASQHQGMAHVRQVCSCCPPPPNPNSSSATSSATNMLFQPTVIPGPSLTQNASSGQMVPLSRIHNNQAMMAYTNGTRDAVTDASSSSASSSSSCASSIGIYRHHPWNQTESTDCSNEYDHTAQGSLSRVFESLQADSSALPMIQSIARIASMKNNYQRSDCSTTANGASGDNTRKTPPRDTAHYADRTSSGWTESQVVALGGGGYHSSVNHKQSSPKPANQVPANIHGHGSRSGTLRDATVMDLTVPKRRFDDHTSGALLLRTMPSPDAAQCQANSSRPPYKIHKMYLEGAKIHAVNSMPFQYDVNTMATVLEVAVIFFPGLSVQTCNQVMAEALRMQLYQCNRMQKELLQKYVNTLLIADQPLVMVTTQDLAAFLPQLKLLLNGTVNRNLVNLQEGAGLELAAKRMRLSASGHMSSDIIR